VTDSRPAMPPTIGLRRNPVSLRSLVNGTFSALAIAIAIGAAIPLFSVLTMLVQQGALNLGIENFTTLAPSAKEPGIGLGPAIQGTVVMVTLACLVALPVGILAGVYLAETRRIDRLAGAVRFATKMLTGMPSILAGVFVFGVIVLSVGFSPFAGAAALSVLILPTVVLTSEEAIRAVPEKMKHAAAGMGCTRSQVIWKVSLPTAMPGILTGVMLSLARGAGETAPLLFTAGFSQFWIDWMDPLNDTSSLSVVIYQFATSPYENWQSLAWTASLILVTLVLVLNLTAQFIISRSPMAQR